ncbi:hypothetical protein K1T71_006083 [Dendrolimus kikuchii]|uniref:Uncharacterized protein n=1 Tax=Dendrolimus kikuchii TaxID=765133 RepID=A0ACC1D304_9NEOP|nr:hypothetical protein K1T71_006083 [Dendrolimus kikuchii]
MASKIHRVRYYNPTPQPINCISFNKISKLIAIARGDASIELWDLNYAPYLLKIIPGIEKGSVEALGWVENRLLSTGLGGALVEWDLDTISAKNTVLLTGYAAWCLDVSFDNTLAAVGTEQGYLNLYTVTEGDISYKKLFDKQEGRILCCKFNNAGNIIITGSVNTIRVWNVNTGHAITRISVSRRDKEVIVWCLAVLSDNIIVSGDSLGRLTFWDGNLGDQVESYTTHKTDILSIAVSEDETRLFCSGVDPIIINFIKVGKNNDVQSSGQWVKHVQRNIHEHDVRGLIINDEQLISVGIDGYLTLSSYPPKWVMRLPPILAHSSSVCEQKGLLLLRYNNHLEVWKLGSYATSENGQVVIDSIMNKKLENNEENKLENDTVVAVITKATAQNTQKKCLKLTEKPVKLVSVQSKGKKQISCCELSPSGELIVYSTNSDIRILKLEADEDQTNISLSKVMINGVTTPCDHIAFAEDSRTMVVHSLGKLQVLQVDPEAGATLIQIVNLDKYFKTKSILHLSISKKTESGKTYLVVADIKGSIEVWILNVKKFEHFISLPKYHCVPSAITVDSKCQTLIISYVDQKLIEYDLVNKKFTSWPGKALPVEWSSRRAPVLAITPHPAREAVVFRDQTSLWVLDRNLQTSQKPSPKKKPGVKSVGLKVVPIKYSAGFHWLNKDEAVSVEVLPQNIVAQLPAIAVGKRHNQMYA